ncbi:hypothetical protein Xaut_3702 [Xanthobacter versatilis]|uniref:Uncharacterized protein n=1 Tax=Xanthobacter autotrophicus (strain ATCC BAA-1158 / Py2) TaxID=78245 RepID=A7ILN6_XANP2|nr:hypothetical protein Xaut_3702 [Xanthobacter autotrophicus Py2]
MAGRKRKAGRRTADGRLAKKPRPQRVRDITDVATSQPHRSWLKEGQRRDQRAESTLGRMFLADLITEPECWAGERLRSIIREFHVVIAAPITASTAAIMVAEGMEIPAEADHLAAERPETEEEKRDRVLAQHAGAMAVLDRLEWGRQITSELDALLMRDAEPEHLRLVKAGLHALAAFWRMAEPPENPNDREVKVKGVRYGEEAEWPHEEKVVSIVYK